MWLRVSGPPSVHKEPSHPTLCGTSPWQAHPGAPQELLGGLRHQEFITAWGQLVRLLENPAGFGAKGPHLTAGHWGCSGQAVLRPRRSSSRPARRDGHRGGGVRTRRGKATLACAPAGAGGRCEVRRAEPRVCTVRRGAPARPRVAADGTAPGAGPAGRRGEGRDEGRGVGRGERSG